MAVERRAVIATWVICGLLPCISLAVPSGMSALAQAPVKNPEVFPLLQFDEANGTCRAKGRLQDKEYCHSNLMDEIVARGKDAIPILISQLTDERVLKRPIFDFWLKMTVGDVASSVLGDLFTDSDWITFNMPRLKLTDGPCNDGADDCWHRFAKAHGRKFIQQQWLAAWNANKDRIYWEAEARCFRLSKDTKATPAPQPE
jgi:hypothetical protein